MEILSLPRRAGKTTKVLNWLAQSRSRALLVMSLAEAERIWRMAGELGLSYQVRYTDGTQTREGIRRDQILTAYDLRAGRANGRGFEEYAIDNAEYVLSDLVGGRVTLLTVTAEEERS